MPIDGNDEQFLALMGLGAKSGKKSHYPELKRRLSELERMRDLLDQARDAIFLLALPEEIVEYQNEAALGLLGLVRTQEKRLLQECLKTSHGASLTLFSLFPFLSSEEQRKIVPLLTRNGTRRFEASFQAAVEGGRTSGILILRDQEERIAVQEQLAASLKAVEEARMKTVRLTAAMVEMKDSYTGKNQRQSARLAHEIGLRLELPKPEIDDLVTAALLHDVGMMGVPTEILCIPGPLRPVDRRLMQEHAAIGRDILAKEGFPESISLAVLHHHERMDGSGYPDGLKGEDIPLFARVVGMADVVEAMLSHRPYRPAHSREEVLRELEEHQETLYDRRTAEICISLLLEGFSVSEETGNKY